MDIIVRETYLSHIISHLNRGMMIILVGGLPGLRMYDVKDEIHVRDYLHLLTQGYKVNVGILRAGEVAFCNKLPSAV